MCRFRRKCSFNAIGDMDYLSPCCFFPSPGFTLWTVVNIFFTHFLNNTLDDANNWFETELSRFFSIHLFYFCVRLTHTNTLNSVFERTESEKKCIATKWIELVRILRCPYVHIECDACYSVRACVCVCEAFRVAHVMQAGEVHGMKKSHMSCLEIALWMQTPVYLGSWSTAATHFFHVDLVLCSYSKANNATK